MTFSTLLYDLTDGIATVTINRPEKNNAISQEMRADFRALADELYGDERVRVVVLTGTGKTFCVGADVVMNNFCTDWVIPGSRAHWAHGFLGPESPWVDLLCARIEEFLRDFPVAWLLFDWFCYGNLTTDYPVQPAWFVTQPFAQILGRPLPERADQITPEEGLRYKREVLARLFRRLRATVTATSPATRIVFSPPYWGPADPLWVDHPMLTESDALLAEYSKPETMEWLLRIRRPAQRVMGTPMGCGGTMSVEAMRAWVERGCDLTGYVWGTPPVLAPHPSKVAELDIVRRAFREIE